MRVLTNYLCRLERRVDPMNDSALNQLVLSATAQGANALDLPTSASLDYLATLSLSDADVQLLLGDAPGLSWREVSDDTRAFYFRLRRRVARLVCNDTKLRDSVAKSVTVSADAAWLVLVHALGLKPEVLAAAALKPIAVGIVVSGAERLCKGPS